MNGPKIEYRTEKRIRLFGFALFFKLKKQIKRGSGTQKKIGFGGVYIFFFFKKMGRLKRGVSSDQPF
jgi:hypothetical protein